MAKPKDPIVADLINKCRELGLVKSELSGGAIIELPTFQDFRKTLHELDAKAKIDTYHYILNGLRKRYGFTKKMIIGRFSLWQTGTFSRSLSAPKSGSEKLHPAEKKARRSRRRGSSDAMFRRVPGSYGSNQ